MDRVADEELENRIAWPDAADRRYVLQRIEDGAREHRRGERSSVAVHRGRWSVQTVVDGEAAIRPDAIAADGGVERGGVDGEAHLVIEGDHIAPHIGAVGTGGNVDAAGALRQRLRPPCPHPRPGRRRWPA